MENKYLKPLVSIGMPVYNGEKFISQTLDSLLAQDYENLELIISDNASTDNTSNICREYMSLDSRLKYFRNEANIGASANYEKVFNHSIGKYFMWAGSHDLWTTNHVFKCVEILESNPDIVLCYSKPTWIDYNGNPIDSPVAVLQTVGLGRKERVEMIIKKLSYCDMFYGLYRTEVLKKCRLGLTCIGFDIITMMEVSLYGTINMIDQPGFLRRQTRIDQDNLHTRWLKNLLRLDPTRKYQKFIYPVSEWGIEHVKSVLMSKLPLGDKLIMAIVVAQRFFRQYNRYIIREIVRPLNFNGIEIPPY